MTDRKPLSDANEPPEDVASLYSWANMHGAKYRDFSAARAQTRENARQRVQQAIDEEKERTRTQVAAQGLESPRQVAGFPLSGEQTHLAELATQLAAQLAAHQAAQHAAERTAQPNEPGAPYGSAGQPFYPAWRSARSEPPPPSGIHPPAQPPYPGYATTQHPAAFAPMREEPPSAGSAQGWTAQSSRELPGRPAWLTEKPEPLAPASPLQTPDDTIQGSRERLTSRWFALKTLFEGNPPVPLQEPVPQLPNSRVPALAAFSLAGGVGKTTLVATLGRALSSRGERVLLVDTAAFGLLPFFFGARDQRLGQLRTFSPPASSGDSPIQMVTLDPEAMGPEQMSQDPLTNEVTAYSRGLSRIIVDLATASGSTARRILKLSPIVLVPVIPDMNSVVSVGSIDAFFEHTSGAQGRMPYYLLNQFDSSLPLHLDVREVLREQIGDRLLPFALRRSPTVSEALAEGMTVMDYAPSSTIAEDFGNLVGWVKSLSAPASAGFRGVRWSER
jgi:cellulose synthase operon protein YhjQ